MAKEDAWPEQLKFEGLVWASGLKTWQKLARRGVWVNGTQDGLGEDEPLGLEQLAPKARFAKLSHARCRLHAPALAGQLPGEPDPRGPG